MRGRRRGGLAAGQGRARPPAAVLRPGRRHRQPRPELPAAAAPGRRGHRRRRARRADRRRVRRGLRHRRRAGHLRGRGRHVAGPAAGRRPAAGHPGRRPVGHHRHARARPDGRARPLAGRRLRRPRRARRRRGRARLAAAPPPPGGRRRCCASWRPGAGTPIARSRPATRQLAYATLDRARDSEEPARRRAGRRDTTGCRSPGPRPGGAGTAATCWPWPGCPCCSTGRCATAGCCCAGSRSSSAAARRSTRARWPCSTTSPTPSSRSPPSLESRREPQISRRWLEQVARDSAPVPTGRLAVRRRRARPAALDGGRPARADRGGQRRTPAPWCHPPRASRRPHLGSSGEPTADRRRGERRPVRAARVGADAGHGPADRAEPAAGHHQRAAAGRADRRGPRPEPHLDRRADHAARCSAWACSRRSRSGWRTAGAARPRPPPH